VVVLGSGASDAASAIGPALDRWLGADRATACAEGPSPAPVALREVALSERSRARALVRIALPDDADAEGLGELAIAWLGATELGSARISTRYVDATGAPELIVDVAAEPDELDGQVARILERLRAIATESDGSRIDAASRAALRKVRDRLSDPRVRIERRLAASSRMEARLPTVDRARAWAREGLGSDRVRTMMFRPARP
jgi:hypothetical protein